MNDVCLHDTSRSTVDLFKNVVEKTVWLRVVSALFCCQFTAHHRANEAAGLFLGITKVDASFKFTVENIRHALRVKRILVIKLPFSGGEVRLDLDDVLNDKVIHIGALFEYDAILT